MKSNDPRIALFAERAKADKRLLIESCFQVVEGDTQQAVPFLFRHEQDVYWKLHRFARRSWLRPEQS